MMKGRFWKKALAAALALLIVSGNMPLQPLSCVFDDIAITANAETVASTITVDSTDYTLFTGFTATGGTTAEYPYFVDGNLSNDWLVTNSTNFTGGTEDPAYVEFHADAPIIPKGYVLTCKHENAGFWKPVKWAFKAKLNEDDEWTTIHSSNTTLGYGKTFEIPCTNDDNQYQYFRFEVYEVGLTGLLRLNELQIYGQFAYTPVSARDATCTEYGLTNDSYLRSDGKYFSDNNGTNELTVGNGLIDKIPHNCEHHDDSDSNIEYWQCSMCGKYFIDEAFTQEVSADEVFKGIFGTLIKGTNSESDYYTLESKTYTLTEDVNTAGYIYVPEGVTATIDLNGHTIDRGLTSTVINGMVIYVEGNLTITDSGTGGTIKGGMDTKCSCVCVNDNVTNSGTFTLQGGTLIGNTKNESTTAVYGNGDTKITISGGKITGDIYGIYSNNVTVSGGEISGNITGIYSRAVSVSGNPVITGNTEKNVWLYYDSTLTITGALAEGASIGISPGSIPTDNAPIMVTTGYSVYNSVSPDTYFFLDNDSQMKNLNGKLMPVAMGWNENRTEIAVGTAEKTVNFDMQGHGSDIESVSLLSGNRVIEPTEPTAEGWSFVAWYTDATCIDGKEWNFNSAVTSDMTLYALWSQRQIYRVSLPENMVLVSTDQSACAGKYPAGTTIRFKVKSSDYVIDGDVKNGDDLLTADVEGIYSVTVGEADVTITATVKKAVEANKELSENESYTAQDGDVLTGSTSGTVTIANNANITLSDVAIGGGIVCEGSATITLVGDNSVTGAIFKAGIQVGGSGTTLSIKGNGSLTANGGLQSAGIGLSRAWEVDATGGDIVIEGGNITANGDSSGAGIGTGITYSSTAELGNITIKGGTVKATGGSSADGIGTGYAYPDCTNVIGKVTIYDGIDKVDASNIMNSENITYKHEENNVTSSKSDYFVIAKDGKLIISKSKLIENIAIAAIREYVYTGSAIKPEPIVTSGSLTFAQGIDYEYSYSNNINAGTAKMTVTFKGDYEFLDSVEKEFTIAKATHTITAPIANTLTYNGNEQELVTAGSIDFGSLLYSLDGVTYSESIPKGTDADTYTVYYKVEGSDNWNAVEPQTVKVTIAKSYTIIWKNGDDILETDSYVPGGATPEYNGETPTKDATAQYTYTFSGWSPMVDTVKGNVTYMAQFDSTAKNYTITYKVDGEVYDTKTVSYGNSIALPNAPTREGYTFSGWQTSYTTMPAQNIEISGTFTINQYAVTYIVDGVQYGDRFVVDHGTKLTAPTDPAKNGAIFLGWTSDGVNAYDFETPVIAETTLTAMWLDANGFITFSEGYAVTDNTYNGTDRDYVGFRFAVNMDNTDFRVVQHGILYGMNIDTFGDGKADANLRFTDEEATALMDKVREFAAQNTDTETTDWIEVYIGDRRDGVVYARGFIIVTDGMNNYLIYSDLQEGSYNSFS